MEGGWMEIGGGLRENCSPDRFLHMSEEDGRLSAASPPPPPGLGGPVDALSSRPLPSIPLYIQSFFFFLFAAAAAAPADVH